MQRRRRRKSTAKLVYRFHGLVAKEWHRGRIILAGDAAHQTPPFAGQGMCSGIRDAVNLAWKLAHVLQGRSERRNYSTPTKPNASHHVRAVTETAIAMGRVVCIADLAAAAGRDAAMLAQRAKGEQPVPPAEPEIGPGAFMRGPRAPARSSRKTRSAAHTSTTSWAAALG